MTVSMSELVPPLDNNGLPCLLTPDIPRVFASLRSSVSFLAVTSQSINTCTDQHLAGGHTGQCQEIRRTMLALYL